MLNQSIPSRPNPFHAGLSFFDTRNDQSDRVSKKEAGLPRLGLPTELPVLTHLDVSLNTLGELILPRGIELALLAMTLSHLSSIHNVYKSDYGFQNFRNLRKFAKLARRL